MNDESKQPDPDSAAKEPQKRHWWEQCPCGSGVRFGKCCGKTSDTCRYEPAENLPAQNIAEQES